jgi:hypothetical protein
VGWDGGRWLAGGRYDVSMGNMEVALAFLGMVGIGSGFLVRSAPVVGVLIVRLLGF